MDVMWIVEPGFIRSRGQRLSAVKGEKPEIQNKINFPNELRVYGCEMALIDA